MRPRPFPFWWHQHWTYWPLYLTPAERVAYLDLAELRAAWKARRYDPPGPREIPGWAWFMLAFCVSFAIAAFADRWLR